MALVTIPLVAAARPLPDEVQRLIREADQRADRLHQDSRIAGFIASDCTTVYAALRDAEAEGLFSGRWFLEWGSGQGVVTCLAAMLGFDAWGVEIEGELVEEARRLAADFDLHAEFVHGSYLPKGAADLLARGRDFKWLDTSGPSGYREMGLDVDDFDVVFVYPWPEEEQFVADLFDRYARPGAVLMSYHGGDDVRLRRKRSRGGKA